MAKLKLFWFDAVPNNKGIKGIISVSAQTLKEAKTYLTKHEIHYTKYIGKS